MSFAFAFSKTTVKASDTEASVQKTLVKKGYCQRHRDIKLPSRFEILLNKAVKNECHQCEKDREFNNQERERKLKNNAEVIRLSEELKEKDKKIEDMKEENTELKEEKTELKEEKTELERKLSSTSLQNEELRVVHFNAILLGDSGVGKSSILRRLEDATFILDIQPTIGVGIKIKKFQIKKNGKYFNINLKVSDTAGQEHYKSICKNYCKNTHAVILVYDINKEDSFKAIDGWLNFFEDSRTSDFKPVILLIGNKLDLEPKVSTPAKWAEENKASFMEYSAKTDKNGNKIDKIIKYLICNILDKDDIMSKVNVPKKTITLSSKKEKEEKNFWSDLSNLWRSFFGCTSRNSSVEDNFRLQNFDPLE